MLKKIGIIGPNKSGCNQQLFEFGIKLGKRIATKDRIVICGGHGGFMEAVCKGVKASGQAFEGQTIGILPGSIPADGNPYIDVAIATGIGIARNIIIVNSVDIIIAAGGGAGTLSEIAFAWQGKKKVICVTGFGGWAETLAGSDLDRRARGLLVAVNNMEELIEELEKHFLEK